MKATGIVRRIDSLGRIVLPIELRRSLQIEEGDPLEIFLSDEAIVLRKATVDCTFCNGTEGLTLFRGKGICRRCREALAQGEGEEPAPVLPA